MPALSAFHSPGAVLGDFPANSDQSRDVRWLLRSSQFDTINSFDPNGADSRVKFSSGLLETCGLVHEPGGIDEVCRVKTNRIGSTPRAMSEYMVLRFVVDDPAAFKIRLTRDDGSIKDLTIGERGGSQTVVFQDVEYLRVFDVLIAHVEPKATRIMESNHPAHIQAAMFEPQAPPAWWISSPDCSNSSGAWQCTTCKTSVQPACLKVFTDYAGAPGGLDRPICPFIEHP